MSTRNAIAIGILATALLGACKEESAQLPPPVEITRDDTGYFCRMIVADHPGPKAQIHLADRERPLFFPSVIDAVAFLMMPGESKAIRAVYVNDMGKAHNWTSPEPGTWINANTAYFVIDSKMVGGMGHKEAVPFGDKPEAEAFVAANGGRIVRLSEMPDAYVFPGSNGEAASAAPSASPMPPDSKESVP